MISLEKIILHMYWKKTSNARLTLRSFRIHCCSGKAISSAYSERVFVALGIQHEMCMCHIFICGLSVSKTFFRRCLIKGTILEESY